MNRKGRQFQGLGALFLSWAIAMAAQAAPSAGLPSKEDETLRQKLLEFQQDEAPGILGAHP